MRYLGFVILLTVLGLAQAHTGLNVVAWQDELGPYQVSVLDDLHPVVEGESPAFITVYLSHKDSLAPEGTKLSAQVSALETAAVLYQGEMPFVSNAADGQMAYKVYLLNLRPASQGSYQFDLMLDGPLGQASKSYLLQSELSSGVPIVEYLPSVLILLVSLGGTALLFLPKPKRKDHYEAQFVN